VIREVRCFPLVGALAGLLLAPAPALLAANKDIERLQVQVAGLQGQFVSLQRVVEETAREVKRLNETLAEQNATMRKGLQDQRLQGEAVQTTLREISDRLGEIAERLQSYRAPAESGTPAGPGAMPSLPAPRELYSQAYADFARGNYDLAIQAFSEYIKAFPDTEFSDNAQYWIGESLYGKQQFEPAIEAWKTLIRDFPSSDKLPDARVKMGMAHEKLGRRSQALLEYRYVIDRYPNSPAARLAREKLNP
jgi:tol-pal system protein YbgF